MDTLCMSSANLHLCLPSLTNFLVSSLPRITLHFFTVFPTLQGTVYPRKDLNQLKTLHFLAKPRPNKSTPPPGFGYPGPPSPLLPSPPSSLYRDVHRRAGANRPQVFVLCFPFSGQGNNAPLMTLLGLNKDAPRCHGGECTPCFSASPQ